MGSVEELCDDIALINKSEKILDGSVKEIKKTYRSNIYNVSFKGNLMGFTNALWAGAEILTKKTEDEIHTLTIKLLRQNKPNDLLQAVLNHSEILSFNEIIPSMNDIFISVVENKTTLNTQSNFTE
jgi:ABC-2 type transport system ATP-binding protein